MNIIDTFSSLTRSIS